MKCRYVLASALLLAWIFLIGVSPTVLTQTRLDPVALGKEFGVIVGPLTPDIRKELNVRLTNGVAVFAIIGNSLAEAAGLKSRVVITEINHRRVHNLEEFGRLLAEVLPTGNFTVGTWEPTSPDNQGQSQQVNFYFVPNRMD
jgi:S1-C subfamily serine protease